MQVSAEVKSFSISVAEARGLRKSLNTEDSLVVALKHCFLFQGASSLRSSGCIAIITIQKSPLDYINETPGSDTCPNMAALQIWTMISSRMSLGPCSGEMLMLVK